MSAFTLAAFYARLTVETAEKLSSAAAAFAANPSGENAAKLKMACDRWSYYQSIARATSAHNV